MTSDAYFFGCWQDSGHYLWLPGMHKTWDPPVEWGPNWKAIDGHYVPNRPGVVALIWTRNGPIPPGWTMLSMVDNSVDKRPGSHATFALRGDGHPFITAAALATWHFPEVAVRIGLRKAVEDTLR